MLERELQRHLDKACVDRGRGDLAEVGVVHSIAGVAEVSLIEEVEKLSAELGPDTFRELEVFEHGEIYRRLAGSAEHAATGVAVGPAGSAKEGCGIDVVAQIGLQVTGGPQVDAGVDIGEEGTRGVGGDTTETLAAIPVEDGDRRPGLRNNEGVQRPVVEQEPAGTVRKCVRQILVDDQGKAVGAVEVGGSFGSAEIVPGSGE